MKKTLRIAVENESEEDLIMCLNFRKTKDIDSSQYDLLEKALVGRWHSQHEDLVNTIYLENLKDDRFVEPILNIALNREIFRWYDDELESTLRKCVHALKTIDSEKSSTALKRLEELNNHKAHYNEYFTRLTNIETIIDKRKKWTLEEKKRRLKLKPIKK